MNKKRHRFQCPICRAIHSTEESFRACEAKPIPKFHFQPKTEVYNQGLLIFRILDTYVKPKTHEAWYTVIENGRAGLIKRKESRLKAQIRKFSMKVVPPTNS